jgi:hypothetical protein
MTNTQMFRIFFLFFFSQGHRQVCKYGWICGKGKVAYWKWKVAHWPFHLFIKSGLLLLLRSISSLSGFQKGWMVACGHGRWKYSRLHIYTTTGERIKPRATACNKWFLSMKAKCEGLSLPWWYASDHIASCISKQTTWTISLIQKHGKWYITETRSKIENDTLQVY